MLDIIIPAYNAHETIWQTLFSIIYQKFDKSFNVYIVNDSSEKDYSDVVKFFKKYINIKEIILEKNSGPGVARQKGLDVSNGEYIIFVDADDVFSNCFAIKNLYNEIFNNDFDQVSSFFIEEKDDKYVLHNDSTTWLHGKIYKRSFIKKYNIKFNDSRINEDNSFNLLLELCKCKKGILNLPTYLWKNNKKSITRINDNQLQIKRLQGYIYNMLWALEWGIKNNADDEQIGKYSFNALSTMYIYYLKYGKESKFFDAYKIAKQILNISKKYKITDEQKRQIYLTQYNFLLKNDDTLKEFVILPKETIYDFLEYLESFDEGEV